MTTECAEVLAQLWEFLDAEMPPGELEGVGQHVATCRECGARMSFDRALLDTLARQRRLVPPGLLVWRVRVGIRSAESR